MTGEGGGEQGERGEVAPAVPAKRGSTASSVMSGGEESVEVPPPPPPKTANRASGGTLGDGVSLVQLKWGHLGIVVSLIWKISTDLQFYRCPSSLSPSQKKTETPPTENSVL